MAGFDLGSGATARRCRVAVGHRPMAVLDCFRLKYPARRVWSCGIAAMGAGRTFRESGFEPDGHGASFKGRCYLIVLDI